MRGLGRANEAGQQAADGDEQRVGQRVDRQVHHDANPAGDVYRLNNSTMNGVYSSQRACLSVWPVTAAPP